MQAKLKERKIILESKQLLGKRDNPSKSATNQRLKLKRYVAFAHIISRNILIRVKKHSDKSISLNCIYSIKFKYCDNYNNNKFGSGKKQTCLC